MSRYYSSILNVLSPSFANTYSLAFDGVDDKVQFNEISLATDYTVSAWAKRNTTANMFLFGNTATYGYGCYFVGASGGVYLQGSTGFYAFTNSAITTAMARTDWVNWVFKRDSTAGTLAIYVDGVLAQSVTTTKIMDKINTIGGSGLNTGSQFIWDGNIDEIAIFNTSAVSLDDLGSSTTPKDLSSISGLTNWYRNGDNGTWKSPQWLIPNNSNVANSRISNYSFSYDGVDDFVDTGITDTGTNDISISCWIKTTETFPDTESRCAFGGIDLTFGANYTLGRLGSEFGSPDDMKVRVFNTFGTTKLNDNSWHNIIYTYDYTSKEVKVYVDGNTTPEISATVSFFRSKKIAIGWNGITSSYHFEGNVDECAYFTSILGASDITSIYNSGVPNDLSSLSPVGYWRSENSTFSTNWTVTDNGSGSNDGTSANMTIEDRVGDAPNSTSNALSYNMTESDRETDVPS